MWQVQGLHRFRPAEAQASKGSAPWGCVWAPRAALQELMSYQAFVGRISEGGGLSGTECHTTDCTECSGLQNPCPRWRAVADACVQLLSERYQCAALASAAPGVSRSARPAVDPGLRRGLRECRGKKFAGDQLLWHWGRTETYERCSDDGPNVWHPG